MYEKKQLLDYYEKMLKIRLFDLKATELRETGQILGNAHAYVGEEAIAVGVCSCLDAKDFIESTHRGHGHTIAKGAELNPMMAELYGKATGYCHGKGGSQHIADFSVGMLGANGIVGGGFGLAVGAALASRYKKTGAISVVFFGDGASNRGTFHEAANMAAAWKLPVIFICENNGWACSTSHLDAGQHSVRDIAVRAQAYNMPGYVVNGNDFFAVREGMQVLANRARKGEGNGCGLLECKTYRILGHHIGDKQPYRDPEAAKARLVADDCLENFKRRCIAEKWLTAADFEEIDKRVPKLIAEAQKFGEDSPYPDPSELYTDLYD
ncbi:MAG: thiamine pyrophosphate-dependent dehydrogenase E1 component subunit alpha [Lachnospiraceae bacterium]|nr:thiamine pyrophosphate-dependent dehydrogenase E1 component subunit alpha [Lachnospiraceae bacterium]